MSDVMASTSWRHGATNHLQKPWVLVPGSTDILNADVCNVQRTTMSDPCQTNNYMLMSINNYEQKVGILCVTLHTNFSTTGIV